MRFRVARMCISILLRIQTVLSNYIYVCMDWWLKPFFSIFEALATWQCHISVENIMCRQIATRNILASILLLAEQLCYMISKNAVIGRLINWLFVAVDPLLSYLNLVMQRDISNETFVSNSAE